ncbi:unnamed protein product [Onchocerca ochengi]|uniref:BZIP domain-containing protein n=1 Tax=Onchocerca ochengi TaxID=42157 RepID=A0A182EF09_ONCOC|nr:unnamed protein product [Onchocerca ochengi]
MIKNWLKWRKAKKLVTDDETYAVSRKDLQHDSQFIATAAYHTATRPSVAHRGPLSCPGDLNVNQYDAYGAVLNRSLYSDIIIPCEMVRNGFISRKVHRRHRQQHRFRRVNASTSEYGSGDPSSLTLHSKCNRNLNDSASDSWTVEYEQTQHIRELEYKVREQRKKLKDYKGRLRAERDLRIVNERNMMEEVEKYKRELKKEQQERKVTEERYIDVIAYMKTKLSLLEQHQPMGQQCLPPSLSFLGDSTINLQNGVSQLGGADELRYSLSVNASSSILPRTDFEQELDETKNFRAEELWGDLETARNSKNTTTDTELSDRICQSITLLKENDSDNDDNGYVTTFEYPAKTTQKNEDIHTDDLLRISL